MEFRSHRLDNGLEIIAETNDDAHSMSVALQRVVVTGMGIVSCLGNTLDEPGIEFAAFMDFIEAERPCYSVTSFAER